MNDDSIATHMHCYVLSVLLTGPGKKKEKKKKKKENENRQFDVGLTLDFGYTT